MRKHLCWLLGHVTVDIPVYKILANMQHKGDITLHCKHCGKPRAYIVGTRFIEKARAGQ